MLNKIVEDNANVEYKKNVDLAIGSLHTLEITGYTHDGRGVGRVGGRVAFVPTALRGERVEVEITDCRKKIYSGKLLRIITPSAERREPVCAAFGGCGGCQLQHMSYAEELRFKQEQVAAALQRIGGLAALSSDVLRPIIGAEHELHYRNKGVFHVSHGAEGSRLCFWDEGTHSPAAAACELLFAPELARVAAWLQTRNLSQNLGDVMLRRSDLNGDMILTAQLTDENRAAVLPLLEEARRQFAEIKVLSTVTPKGWQVHTAENAITDGLSGTRYRISAPAFFQVNNRQTERLLATVAEFLGADCHVLIDAYCGIGTIGLYLAGHLPELGRLIGIEINETAVENACANAELNGIANTEFYAGKAEQLFSRVLPNGAVDAVVIDPPRRGCHADLLRGLLDLQPPTIVYVSCNPATLARDLTALAGGGYRVAAVQPVDMFPRTHHVETVVLLSKGRD